MFLSSNINGVLSSALFAPVEVSGFIGTSTQKTHTPYPLSRGKYISSSLSACQTPTAAVTYMNFIYEIFL